MKEKVNIIYKKFNENRKKEEIKKANNQDSTELEDLEKKLKILTK
jgi:hypothetical protein